MKAVGSIVCCLVTLAGCAMRGPAASAPPLPAAAIVATIPIGTPPTYLAISPDGARVFAASSGQLSIVRTSDNAVTATVPIRAYTSGVAVTPDGARVLIDSVTGVSLTVVDAATGAEGKSIPLIVEVHPGGYQRIAVAPGGRRAYVANVRKEYLAIADLSGGPASQSLMDLRPSDVTFSPDGRVLYVTGCKEFCTTGTVEALDASTLQTLRTFSVGPSPYRFALSPDGARAYTTNLAAPSLSILDVASGSVVATTPVGVEPTGLAVSPDGARVYVVSQMQRTLAVIDARDGSVEATVGFPNQPREVVVSPDGRRLYLSTQTSLLVIDPSQLE
jgi:YVTN family beta-propeller protein